MSPEGALQRDEEKGGMPGLSSRRGVPALCVVLKPTWHVAFGRYNIEALLTIVTCLLDGTVSKQARMYKWILVTACLPFLLFLTHVYRCSCDYCQNVAKWEGGKNPSRTEVSI